MHCPNINNHQQSPNYNYLILPNYYSSKMFNNFISDDYHSHNIILQASNNLGSLLLGDFNAATDQEVISKNNIKTIITAADGMQHLNIQPSITHITYPLLDIKHQKISAFFEQNYSNIETNLKKGGVLVHCAAGVSRSATLIIAYLMKRNKWNFKQSVNFVRNIRPIVCPNFGFQMQLKQYQKDLNFHAQKLGKTMNVNPRNIFGFVPDKQFLIPKVNERSSFPILNSLSRAQTRKKSKKRNDIESRQRVKIDNMFQVENIKRNLIISSILGNDSRASNEYFRDSPLDMIGFEYPKTSKNIKLKQKPFRQMEERFKLNSYANSKRQTNYLSKR